MITTWVFAAGMRRSGSAMQYHWAKELVELAGGMAFGFTNRKRIIDIFKEHDGVCPYILVKNHIFMPDISPTAKSIFNENKHKVFYIYRDIRDVAASYIQFRPGQWDRIITKELPAVLNEYKRWNILPKKRMFVANYEQLRPCLTKAFHIKEMADFLGIGVTKAQCTQIDGRHIAPAHQKLIETFFEENPDKKYDKENCLWHNHMNDGRVGKYKDVLTPEQLKQVNAIAGEWLKARGYT